MSSDPKDQNAMSRRAFATRVGGVAAAAFVAGNDFLHAGRGQRGAVCVGPRHRRQRQGRGRQHRHPRPGQRPEAGLRTHPQRRDQDAVRHRRQSRRRARQRRAAEGRRDVQARLRAGPAPRPRRQGHRRGDHRHAEPVARAGDDLGAAGRQARLRREAGVLHGVGRAADGECRQPLQQGRAGRHDEPQPARRAAGHRVHPEGRHRQGAHGARPVLQGAARHRQVSRRPARPRREVPPQRRDRARTSRRGTRPI